jgi:hypothetical protein
MVVVCQSVQGLTLEGTFDGWEYLVVAGVDGEEVLQDEGQALAVGSLDGFDFS